MRFYAERPMRVARQLLADVLVIGWVWLVVTIAKAAQRLIDQLQGPAGALTSAGQSVSAKSAGEAEVAAASGVASSVDASEVQALRVTARASAAAAALTTPPG